MKFNYKIWCKLLMFCLFGDTLSFMMFSLFSSAVLLLHNQTQSICATPITFFVQGDLEQARHSLATWQDSRWRRIFAWSFLYQVFPHLCEEAIRYMSRSNFTKSKGKFFMELILSSKYSWKRNRFSVVIVNICETQNEWLIRSYCLMSLMDIDWSDV